MHIELFCCAIYGFDTCMLPYIGRSNGIIKDALLMLAQMQEGSIITVLPHHSRLSTKQGHTNETIITLHGNPNTNTVNCGLN